MITPENIASHEFIGLDVEVIKSTNLQIIGLNGRVIDETKSMITINTINGTRMIAKKDSIWRFTINDNKATVNGSQILKRPYDRIGGKI